MNVVHKHRSNVFLRLLRKRTPVYLEFLSRSPQLAQSCASIAPRLCGADNACTIYCKKSLRT